jgi:lipopolysaccharide/colanic/teichoic acid biosynthesis glycosyltransferase
MGRVSTFSTTTAAESRRLPLRRVVDLVVGGLLLALALPLLAVLALAVRTSSNGPVLHRERTRDRHGRAIEILRFRTTIDGGTTQHHQRMRAVVGASAADPVTGIGRVLRGTRLDRLPWLFSVLRGDRHLF